MKREKADGGTFSAPASRYFGEPTEEPEEDSERESRAIPGLFGDTVVFGPMKSLSEPTQNKPDDEYKTKLMTAIGSAKAPQSAETIEKPGVILKRGPLSETSGLEPLPQVIPAEEFVGSGDDKPASIEDQPFTNPAAGNQPEEEQMMLSGFGEEPETEKIDEDELRSELDKKRAEKKKKFVLLGGLGDDEPQEDENLPEEKEDEPEEQHEKKKKHSEKAPLEYEKPEQRGRVYNSLKNAASQFKTSVIGLCVLEGVSLLLLLIPKILEWAAIDAPAFDRGGAGLAAANIVLLLGRPIPVSEHSSGVKACNGRVTGGAGVGGRDISYRPRPDDTLVLQQISRGRFGHVLLRGGDIRPAHDRRKQQPRHGARDAEFPLLHRKTQIRALRHKGYRERERRI